MKKRGNPVQKKNYFGPGQSQTETLKESSSHGQGGNNHAPQGAQLMELSDDWTLIRTENDDFYGEYHGNELLEALYEKDGGIIPSRFALIL